MIELLGIMVYIPSDYWEVVIEMNNFLEHIHNILANGLAEDDIVLECVMLISTICRTEGCA